MSKMLTVTQFAEKMNVSRTKVYAMIKNGQIPVVRIGERGTRIPQDFVEKLIQESYNGTTL